ncbi:MAG: TonB-dependent siderophore receptor [Bacteroidota bacterium]
MKKILLIILVICIYNASFAQLIITGKVVDQLQAEIPGATLTFKKEGVDQGVISDINGMFEITLSETGEYMLEARFLGYDIYTKSYKFLENKSYSIGNIVLNELAQELQTVEVLGRSQKDYNSEYSFSATKIAIKNQELPQSISSVTKELIADRQAFQLADAVKIVSGVAPSSFYNQYNIRGISQNEEGQIINGLRTRQYYFLQPITSHIERVEVLKGPASVSFSSVDPGGSINMVTKKPLAEDRKEISMSVGSFSTVRSALDFTGSLNESKTLLYRVNAAFQEAKSYRDLITNNALLFTPSISYIPNNKTAINAELIYSESEGKLDRGQPIFGATAGVTDLNSTPVSLNLGAPDDFFDSKELIIMANLVHKFSEKIGFNASYMKQTWTEDLQEHRTVGAFAPDIENQPIASLAAMRFVQRQQFWNIDNLNAYFNFNFNVGKVENKLLVGYDLSSWHKTKGGGQNSARGFLLNDETAVRSFDVANAENYQTITIDGNILPRPNVSHFDLDNPSYTISNTQDYVINSIFAIPSALTTTYAIYIQEQLKLGKFSALLSLRREWFEDITNYDAPNERSFTNTATIPRIGLTYEVTSNINVYATYLEGYQPQSNTVTLMPSTSAFFWDPNSPARFEPLISDLKEIGAKAQFFDNTFTLTTAVYEINQENILMNANLPDFPDSLVQRGADRSRGFEIDIAGYILPNWQVNASYSYIDARIIADQDESLVDQRKENTPVNSANLWTRYNFSQNSVLKDLGIGLGLQHSGSKIPWFTREFIVPDYTIMDMALYYTPVSSNIQLALNVNNLFDTSYWIGAQNYLRLFPGAPRNFLLTASYKF